MIGSVNLGVGSVPTAGDNAANVGTGDVDSVTATVPAVVNNTDPANPVINVATVAPPAIGPASVGTSNDLARGNHTHPTIQAANAAALALVDASAMNAGTFAYVTTLKCWFKLEPSTQAAVALVRIAALGKAGHLWLREALSPAWWNQVVWFINPAVGNDENIGLTAGAGNALQTFGEYRRRHWQRWLPGAETGTVTVTIAGGNLGASDFVSAVWSNMGRAGDQALSVIGTPAVVASGTIVAGGFTAQNRGAGQRNTINAGFSWAAHVGRLVRLTATPTTTAVVMQDLGGNVCALGEQSVNGVLGVGFTVGQAVEVITSTQIPGGSIGGGGGTPNIILLQDLEAATGFSFKNAGGSSDKTVNALRCRFLGNGSVRSIGGFKPTACSFLGPGAQTIDGTWFGDLNTTVNVNLNITQPQPRNHFAGHTSQGPAMTLQPNTYTNISGTSSGTIGIFGLAAGEVGVEVGFDAHFSCSNMWGSGNAATSTPIHVNAGGHWSKVGVGPNGFGGMVAPGNGLVLETGNIGSAISIPLAQLPSVLGLCQQPAPRSYFTGKVTSGVGAVFSWCGFSDAPAANQAVRWGNPVSEQLALKLRVNVRVGAIGVPLPVTLYKNGVATTMIATIPAGSAVGTIVTDALHPILFADGDQVDVRADAAIDGILPGTIQFSAAVEWAG